MKKLLSIFSYIHFYLNIKNVFSEKVEDFIINTITLLVIFVFPLFSFMHVDISVLSIKERVYLYILGMILFSVPGLLIEMVTLVGFSILKSENMFNIEKYDSEHTKAGRNALKAYNVLIKLCKDKNFSIIELKKLLEQVEQVLPNYESKKKVEEKKYQLFILGLRYENEKVVDYFLNHYGVELLGREITTLRQQYPLLDQKLANYDLHEKLSNCLNITNISHPKKDKTHKI